MLFSVVAFAQDIDGRQVAKWDLDSFYYVAFSQIGNNLTEAEEECNRFFKTISLLNDSSFLGYALDLKALEAFARDEVDSALYYGERAIAVFKEVKDSLGLSTAIYNESLYREFLGEYTASLILLHKAREIDIRTGLKLENDIFYYLRYSDIVYQQGQYELALHYAHQAWNAMHKSGYEHEYLIPELHLNYAWLYHELGVSELAEYHANKTYSYTKVDSMIVLRADALDILSQLALGEGDTGLAINYAERSFDLNKRYGDAYYIAYSHSSLMDLYMEIGDLDKAKIHVEPLIQALEDYKVSPVFTESTTDILYQYYVKVGSTDQAISYLELNRDYRERIASFDGLAAMKEFDQEMANRALDLAEAKAEIQAQEIGQQRIYLAAAFLFLIIVISFLVFFITTNRKVKIANLNLREKNELIQKQKDEIDTQKGILTERNKELELLNNSKNRLFSILAHDLRQPFNQILGLISLMDSDVIDKKDRKGIIEGLKTSVQTTSDLVNNVLTWSKAQFAGVNLKPVSLPLAQTIKKSLLYFSVALTKKKIRVIFSISEEIYIRFDKDHFESVMRNLFSNAYKFSPSNSTIYINAEIDESANQVRILIKDEGIGMDNFQRDKLLKGEGAGDSFLGTLNEHGAGIGMVLVRDFLKENGATFDIKSKINEGSTFIIDVPMARKTASLMKA